MGEKAIDRDKRKALEAVARAVSVEEFYPLMDFVMGSAGAVYRRGEKPKPGGTEGGGGEGEV